MPTLYIVSTPIGNLEDITLRALRILREVRLIAAEDTRVTRKLLSHYDIHTRLTSFNEHNQSSCIPELLSTLHEGDIALVSDAGTPGVNDPGQTLVNAAIDAGFSVVAVPGASAVTASVAVSGLVEEPFVYLGFLPRKKSERVALLQSLLAETRPAIAFESPRRLRRSLQDLDDMLGDRRIAICREMTKLHEEVFRGTASDALAHYTQPRGEFTLVIAGAANVPQDDRAAEQTATCLIAELRVQGAGAKHAVAHVSAVSGLSRRRVYQLWLEQHGD
ncbi:MAG: 16S rRNA (cytidine(1402)-2'-O)-methyltransferase [Chloroflexota bacterium]|nr:16S rRNA (cytidine(1402)-2'-O)-methyltransferase [Chloroflexota bacterium]